MRRTATEKTQPVTATSSMKSSADVIVVGGGVIGCAVAYELARRSVDVLLIDKSLPGRASSASAGGLWPIGEAVGLGCGIIQHATTADDSSLDNLELLPEQFREFLKKSNSYFPELADELEKLTEVDIEFEVGAGLLFLFHSEEERKFVQRVAATISENRCLEMLNPNEVRRVEPHVTGDLLGAVLLSGEHQVNPMLLTEAFKRAAITLGARVLHDTQVTALRREGDRIAGVLVGDELFSCEMVVNAAGAWAGKLANTANLTVPVFPVRGQILLTHELPHTLNACISTAGCYLAQKQHGEILIGSTTEDAGFDVSVTQEAITRLARSAVQSLPMLQNVGIKRIWSGLRPGTSDELPILGPVDGIEGYVNATGGFRTGIVAAPLTARIVAQCVLDEELEFPIDSYLARRFAGEPKQVETLPTNSL